MPVRKRPNCATKRPRNLKPRRHRPWLNTTTLAASGRDMPIAEYLKGHPVLRGDLFAPAPATAAGE